MNAHTFPNVRRIMVGWHTKRTLSNRTRNVKPSYIIFPLIVSTAPWNCNSFWYQHAHVSKTRETVFDGGIIAFIFLDVLCVFLRPRPINGSILFLNRNFKVNVDAKDEKKNPRGVLLFERSPEGTVALSRRSLLHTHRYSPCRFSDTDLFSIPGRWSLYPRLIEIITHKETTMITTIVLNLYILTGRVSFRAHIHAVRSSASAFYTVCSSYRRWLVPKIVALVVHGHRAATNSHVRE